MIDEDMHVRCDTLTRVRIKECIAKLASKIAPVSNLTLKKKKKKKKGGNIFKVSLLAITIYNGLGAYAR
jgi:hypothetical protein